MSASFGVKRLRHVGSAPRVFALKTLVTQKLYRKMIPYAATHAYINIYISLSIFGLSLRGVGISLGGVGPLDPLSEGSGPSFKLKRGVARGHEGSRRPEGAWKVGF